MDTLKAADNEIPIHQALFQGFVSGGEEHRAAAGRSKALKGFLNPDGSLNEEAIQKDGSRFNSAVRELIENPPSKAKGDFLAQFRAHSPMEKGGWSDAPE